MHAVWPALCMLWPAFPFFSHFLLFLLVQDWVHGKRQGQGTYTYADGSVYTGVCNITYSSFSLFVSSHYSALSPPCRAMGQRQDPWEGRVSLPQRKQVQVSRKN